MYVEPIQFKEGMPAALSICRIDESALHCHEDAIEIIFVLKGSARVKVSFEYHTLREGDYVVVNREDCHKIWSDPAGSDNLIATIQMDLESFRGRLPYIYYVLISCESFDLAKYKGQANMLRQMMARIMLGMMQAGGSGECSEQCRVMLQELMTILVKEYALENYYNRDRDIGDEKLDKYYTIMKYMYEKYDAKDLLGDISVNEFYSKSYITHLFREVSATSFQDMLSYIRIYKSERMLLETNANITEISERCGFSDTKYYTRDFRRWFLVNPSDYRKKYQKEIGRASRMDRIDFCEAEDAVRRYFEIKEESPEYKVSMTPLTLKNIGSKTDLLKYLRQDEATDASEGSGRTAGEKRQADVFAVIRIDGRDDPEKSKKLLEEMADEYRERSGSVLDFWLIR